MSLSRLINVAPPPALPQAPPSPLKGYTDQLNNALRLFFNSIGNAVLLLTGTNGARFLEAPNALFYDDDDQPLDTVDVGQAVRFNTTYLNNSISVNGTSTSELTVTYPGVYSFHFTGQVVSASASDKKVWVWLVRNNVDVGFSTREYDVSGTGKALEISWDFIIDLQADDHMQLFWASDDADVALEATAANSIHPGIPSAVVSVTFVSVLPAILPVLP